MTAPPALPAAPRLELLTPGVLRAVMPRCQVAVWVAPLTAACLRFEIITPLRLASFLAQVGHESGDLNNLEESLNYTPAALRATWPGRFNAALAEACGRTAAHPADQPRIAEIAYGRRMGNVLPGDAWRYRGAGAIQLTGFDGHNAFAVWAGLLTTEVPAFLRTPEGAALSAAWYWHGRALNPLADAGQNDTISCRINGAKTPEECHGIEDRRARYKRARLVLVH